MIWLRARPTQDYWDWAAQAPCPLVTVLAAKVPELWIVLALDVVANLCYLAQCLTNEGPLYMAI